MASGEQLEQALRRWREGDRRLRREVAPDLRAGYGLAAGAALAYLQRFTTLGGLVGAYLDPATHDALLDAARRPGAQGAHLISPEAVVDAAFWRRAQELSARRDRGP
jgi:hypothetical protein